MKTVKLLLANSDRRSSNLSEVVIRDLCFERAIVECTRTSRIDEFLFLGTREQFDLIIVAPDHLVPEPSRKMAHVPVDEALRGIRRIKRQCAAPMIAVCVPAGYESALIEAGAAAALGLFFRSEALEVESCESAHQTEPECETHKHLRRTELMWDWGPRLLHDRSLAIGRRIPVLLADQPKLSQQTASPGRGRTRGTVLAALALEAVTRRASRSAVRIASGMTS